LLPFVSPELQPIERPLSVKADTQNPFSKNWRLNDRFTP